MKNTKASPGVCRASRVTPLQIAGQAIFYPANFNRTKGSCGPDNRNFYVTGGAKIHKRSSLGGLFFCLGLAALLGGCGLFGGVQRNKAGTRSVTLAEVPVENKAPVESAGIPWPVISETPENPGPAAAFPPENPGPAALPPEDLPAPEAVLAAALSGEIIDIKEKLFIAQTNDVYLNPDAYMGKTIRLEGLFKSEFYTDIDTNYCFVLRYGPGCCGNDGSAGFEVAWDPPFPADYPEIDDWIEAVGVLKTYDEDGYPYLYLSLVSLTIKDERGMEFVSH
ncbi:MAG: hypothetical protein LBD78_11395 [Spirochaetaceae bacterium]|nr:hypothetical protein [Spirochaetaceae bacterium]